MKIYFFKPHRLILALSATLWASSAIAYCAQGSESGGQCWAPAGPNGQMVPIGYAQPNNYSSGSSPQYTPPPRVDSIQCEALGNGYQRCAHYYDVTRTSLKSVMTLDPNNVVIGEYLNYYDNGRLKNIMRYNDKGLKHGTIVHYWKNGKPKGDIQYQNDLEHGLSHEYDEDGKLFKVWEYNQGHLIHSQEMDGKIKHGKEEFYRTNNKGEDEVYRTQEWENGKLVK